MKAFQDLISTDYGIMSLIGILMMVGGLAYAYVVLRRKMAETSDEPGK
ncbi:DUF3149 domain-containing protein [Rhodoferax antarcticus]|uniref:DUF3149 domain-containing protein n=1 Tax=Rhodoferax antarcticus ANT.BR TaxID=1111071 RepID=A0A1Q8YDF6_9BURK|nr:DUF3149 domain-containing protein [Rhodoferax antarcticus]MCW2310497.1 hypothetical protein [Rhodoferax antarcticus]OLP06078.1 hypothetical protein BLL52_2308 [Rhodoferax antarcticus ANT.BR]